MEDLMILGVWYWSRHWQSQRRQNCSRSRQ